MLLSHVLQAAFGDGGEEGTETACFLLYIMSL